MQGLREIRKKKSFSETVLMLYLLTVVMVPQRLASYIYILRQGCYRHRGKADYRNELGSA